MALQGFGLRIPIFNPEIGSAMTEKSDACLQSFEAGLDRRLLLKTGAVAALAASVAPAIFAKQSKLPASPRLSEFAPPLRVGFQRIFDPSQGESQAWYINDHSFIRDHAGTWHLFGITATEPAKPNRERFLLHATAHDLYGPWTKHAPVMQADPAENETVIWAPHVIEHEGRYWMFYCGGGASHAQYRINLATSSDLFSWNRCPSNPLIVDGFDARDPMVLRVGSQWVLYYCATESPAGGNHVVAAVTSSDLIHWSNRRIVFRSPEAGTFGGPTESPFVVIRNGRCYLFLCTNSPYNNTEVYVSNSPFLWDPRDVVLRIGAHAAEVIDAGDGKWFVSSAGWGQGGLYLSSLTWSE
ncbi:MAG TPA: hypothetical protein VKU93_07495 [Terracidiphilus sp.]|jgi:predicted GH43/DUF377 family glycosyl hydrolase|nr:hypothetical protein [Terracidiphilus sp.]